MKRLVVVDPIGNPGGGSRFIRRLLPALRAIRPSLEIQFCGNPISIERDGLAGVLAEAGIGITRLEWTNDRTRKSYPLHRRLAFKLRRATGREDRNVATAIEARSAAEIRRAAAAADVAFFPWPYWFGPPNLDCAIATTIHDLNFKYFFGTPIFARADAERIDVQMEQWAAQATTIASSEFMADEIARHYPKARPSAVIRLAPFAESNRTGSAPTAEVRALGRYLLCGTHLTVHKNLGALIAAQAILRTRFPGLRLVITGSGTEAASGRSTSVGTIVNGADPDVIGLGYVSNERIDALISGAAVVVNPSLYEAGNGPGVDAWSLGTPVAMSDIPAFREHLPAQGVEAALFDPRDPDDIAAKISDVLEHRDVWSAKAAASKVAIDRRTWTDVAADYLAVLEGAVPNHVRG